MSEDDGKALIARGVRAVVEARALEDGDVSSPFLTAWVVGYEIASVELERDQVSAGGTIAPDGQSSHLSRGIAMASVDFWGLRGD